MLRFEVEREYVATVDVADPEAGEPGEALVAALREGVSTADGVYKADVSEIDGRDVRVIVREGKNRMVRRYALAAVLVIASPFAEQPGCNVTEGDACRGCWKGREDRGALPNHGPLPPSPLSCGEAAGMMMVVLALVLLDVASASC